MQNTLIRANSINNKPFIDSKGINLYLIKTLRRPENVPQRVRTPLYKGSPPCIDRFT